MLSNSHKDTFYHLIPASRYDVALIESVITPNNVILFNLDRNSFASVINADLEMFFDISTKKLLSEKPGNVKEMMLIHVTGAANVQSIVRDNFDIRLLKRQKYGLGVSFSEDAQYANKHANHDIGPQRAFIICRVLVSVINDLDESSEGPLGWDTTIGNKGKVIVKYNLNQVLPKYVAYYNCYDHKYQPVVPAVRDDFKPDHRRRPAVPASGVDFKPDHRRRPAVPASGVDFQPDHRRRPAVPASGVDFKSDQRRQHVQPVRQEPTAQSTNAGGNIISDNMLLFGAAATATAALAGWFMSRRNQS